MRTGIHFSISDLLVTAMRNAATIRYLLTAVFTTVALSLEPAAFHRIFDGILTTEQTEQLAHEYNEGVKTGKGKEMGLAYLLSVDGIKQTVINRFVDVWRKDLMLRRLHGASMRSIQDDIAKDLKVKVTKWKMASDKEHESDFSMSELTVIRKLLNEVPSIEKVMIQNKLNKPLESFKERKEMEKLLAALTMFHKNEDRNHGKKYFSR